MAKPKQPADTGGALVAVGKAKDVTHSAYREVDTQTYEIGIIVPPPDIKAIADKTAQFVAKNGTLQVSVASSAGEFRNGCA